MSKNNPRAEVTSVKGKVKSSRRLIFAFCVLTFAMSAVGCRYDMQDQPRYKAYKESDFFSDKKAMRDLPEGTVPRGHLNENKAFYTGKKENADPNAQAQTVTDSSGNTVVASFPNDITDFPVPVTQELVDRGQQRFNIYCIVCHGPTGNGDGMIVRRGFSKPPTYHDDRLRNAPVGHFFDVMTNGWGKMNSYASQIPAADRWAIVAYIRTLQLSQNPTGAGNTTTAANTMNRTNTVTATPAANTQAANTNTQGGGR
jgi:mono/diheme cytochrome c family protein